jgi:hypothetical protein
MRGRPDRWEVEWKRCQDPKSRITSHPTVRRSGCCRQHRGVAWHTAGCRRAVSPGRYSIAPWKRFGIASLEWDSSGVSTVRPEQIVDLQPGLACVIPFRTAFQFRASTADEYAAASRQAEALEILIATFPGWPGEEEAIKLDQGRWTGF